MPVVTIDGQRREVSETALAMALQAYDARSQNRRLGFRQITRQLQASGYDIRGHNDARDAASLGAWASGATSVADLCARLNVSVDSTMRLVDRGAAGSRIVERRTTTARFSGAPARVAGRIRQVAADVVATVRGVAASLTNGTAVARTIGIEVECHGSRSEIGRAVYGAVGGLAYSDHSASPTVFQVGTDGSVGADDCTASGGVEARFPAIRVDDEEGWALYRSALAAMRSAGASVCANGCGHSHSGCCAGGHVHVGADDLTVGQVLDVLAFYVRHESAFESVTPYSRRRAANYYYCQSSSAASVLRDSVSAWGTRRDESARGVVTGARYSPVNLSSITHKGTIEFRAQASSLDVRKWRAWVTLVSALVSNAAAGTLPSGHETDPIEVVATGLGLSASMAAYLQGRAR